MPHGSQPYDRFALMRPSGPGSLGDTVGEDSAGTWTLSVADDTSPDNGVLDQWCVRAFDTASGTYPVSNLTCVSSATVVGALDLTWSNVGTYDAIDIFINGALEATLSGSETSFTTVAGPNQATYDIAIEGTLVGVNSSASNCTATVTFDAPSDFTCSLSSTVAGVVEMNWINNSPYDQINVYRDGTLQTTLPAGTTNYTSSALPLGTDADYAVEGEAAMPAIVSDQTSCSIAVEIPPPSAATCSSATGSGVVDVSWVNNFLYDQINIYLNGALQATLAGNAVNYTLPPMAPATVEIAIEGELLTPPALTAQDLCGVSILDLVDFEQCSAPGSTIGAMLPPTVDSIAPIGTGFLVGRNPGGDQPHTQFHRRIGSRTRHQRNCGHATQASEWWWW